MTTINVRSTPNSPGQTGVAGTEFAQPNARSAAGDSIELVTQVLTEFESSHMDDLKGARDRMATALEQKKVLRAILDKVAKGDRAGAHDMLVANEKLLGSLGINPSDFWRQDGETGDQAKVRLQDMLKGQLDNMSDASQQIAFELQIGMTRLSQAATLKSNISAKDSSTKDAIIGNIRG